MFYFKAKMHKKSISSGVPPQTLLGELTALPQFPIAGFKGPYF